MFVRHPQLGLIPDWQMSFSPDVNPKINKFVKFPQGVTQQTIQPIGPYYQNSDGSVVPGMAGSGDVRTNARGGLLGFVSAHRGGLLGGVVVGATLLGLALARR
jgi:hypothetical protein